MATGGTALVAIAFPNVAQRARAFGVMGVISGVAMALGPTLGGFLASWLGWRWIFFANIPFCLALALAVPLLVAETNDKGERRLDPVGIALLTISLGLAIDALLRRDGSLVLRAACLVGSTATAVLFIWQQWRSPRPVLDPRVFATSTMAGVAALLTALQFGYWAVVVYLPLFLSAAIHITARLLPEPGAAPGARHWEAAIALVRYSGFSLGALYSVARCMRRTPKPKPAAAGRASWCGAARGGESGHRTAGRDAWCSDCPRSRNHAAARHGDR
jgi:MFS family permease